MTFTEAMLRARMSKGITTERAADILGVSRQMIFNYEHGKSYPELGTAIRIASVLGFSLGDIEDGKPSKEFVKNLIKQMRHERKIKRLEKKLSDLKKEKESAR